MEHNLKEITDAGKVELNLSCGNSGEEVEIIYFELVFGEILNHR